MKEILILSTVVAVLAFTDFFEAEEGRTPTEAAILNKIKAQQPSAGDLYLRCLKNGIDDLRERHSAGMIPTKEYLDNLQWHKRGIYEYKNTGKVPPWASIVLARHKYIK